MDVLDSELLKDYLAYARAVIKPRLTEEAGQELVQVGGEIIAVCCVSLKGKLYLQFLVSCNALF